MIVSLPKEGDKCKICGKQAIIKEFCEKHYLEDYEKRLKEMAEKEKEDIKKMNKIIKIKRKCFFCKNKAEPDIDLCFSCRETFLSKNEWLPIFKEENLDKE